MKEVWKPIPNFEGLYDVSNFGRVKSLPRNGTISKSRILKPLKKKSGYLDIVLQKNGKRTYKHIHQIVALTFIPNPLDKPQVNHKDGNKYNNHVNNLEWNTASENLNHKYRILKCKPSRHHMKSIVCLETGEIFDSIKAAERKYGESYGAIQHYLVGKTKSAYGLHWRVQ